MGPELGNSENIANATAARPVAQATVGPEPGGSVNAVKTQIWIALCVHVLIAIIATGQIRLTRRLNPESLT